ncbi:MAG TPA: hypothetical protein VGX68_06525 [Thermoanaerobaculia bacterium]|jgi:hypothetical protein|nr:hypothetical protein [Thermoanaerobaculia bacterium]
MNRNRNLFRVVRFAVASLALFGFAAAQPAAADPNCKQLHGWVSIAITGDPSCTAPGGLCAIATFHGALRGEGNFVATSLTPNVDTPVTAVVLVTGDNQIHTADGDLFTKDAIVFNTIGQGEFAEVDTIIGGTGGFAGATGRLQALGSNLEGSYVAELCLP